MPERLARALVKFLKLMHDNKQTTKVAKARLSSYNAQPTLNLRYSGVEEADYTIKGVHDTIL